MFGDGIILEKNIFSRKNIVKGLILTLTIGIAVFLLVFLLTIDKNTLKSLQHMKESYLVFAAVAIFLAFMVEGLRIQTVARAIGEKIGFWKSVKIFYISFFLGGITPYFSGTIPAQIALFTKNGIPIGKATMISTVRPIVKTIVFLVVTPVLFFYFRESVEEYGLLSWLLLVAAIFFSLLTIFLFILIVRNPEKINSVIQWLRKVPLLQKYFDKPDAEQKIEWLAFQAVQFNKSFNLLLENLMELFLIFLYTAVYWFLYFSIATLLLLAMEIQVDYALVMIIQVLIFFVLPFLPTPGGSGAAELGFVSLFSFFVAEHLLGIYVGGWRLFTFYINIIIGAVLSLFELKKWAEQEKIIRIQQ